MPVFRFEIETHPDLTRGHSPGEAKREMLPQVDARGAALGRRLQAHLGLQATDIRSRSVYLCALEDVTQGEAADILRALVDPVLEHGTVGMLPDQPDGADAPEVVEIGLRPGVTDSVGRSVLRAAEDCLGRSLTGTVYTATIYRVWGLSREQLSSAAAKLLYNPLIETLQIHDLPRRLSLTVPRAGQSQVPPVATVPVRGMDDEALLQLSQRGMLALNLHEMKAIAAHFAGLGRDPTDAELECLAQTWSEHCKHKIFASPIFYTDPAGNTRVIKRGLFRTHIRGATEAIAEVRTAQGVDPEDAPFLVSVFHDNAGVVRLSEADHLVYKVETHNSPSALDPYGGAMTGIVGVNRDSLGTGLGADLLTNVWGYCLGPPDHDQPLPPGLMHPSRIREGVHAGVIDGGNQSGIPYSRGFELFDTRYLGKPLVYCGTVAVMPVQSAGQPTHEKRTKVGDRVVMLGGRIGKDGIHGATFSSVELDEDSPVQAVQIGDPITQKMMADFLLEARDRGLYSGITDNGAGGLSSSVGEMAEATGGAHIDLAKAPLKYPGLAPWEILISEAQERMSVAVPPEHLEAFMALARAREVEATDLGCFTDSGRFVVDYGQTRVVDLTLEFLHNGVPLGELQAVWQPPTRALTNPEQVASASSANALVDELRTLLTSHNFASHEQLARHYDHEVKGLSVVKPLIGVHRDIPSTATVMRVRHHRHEGVVLAEGIHPHYSDIDTYAMATAAVDEGVRRVLCAGARLDRLSALDNFCWPDPIVSAKNPDGAHKLAQLVRACEGLRDACETYGAPLISGKDSMKNDAYLGGVKISIPPTLLISVMGQMPDVRKALELAPLCVGDDIYVVGETRDELGASQWARLHGWELDSVPRTDLVPCMSRYRAFVRARDAGRVRSAHVTSRGGLAVAFAHMAMASGLQLEIDVDGSRGQLSPGAWLFSESTGRFVMTAGQEHRDGLRRHLGAHGLIRVGSVVAGPGGLSLQTNAGTSMLTSEQLRTWFHAREEGRHAN